MKELAAQLESLEGEHSFRTEKIVDKPTGQARESIRRAIKRAGQQGSTLLFYYFGHGLKHPFRDELYFFASDSELDDPGGMLKFSDVVGWLAEYQPASSVIILDCCHAGTVAEPLRLTGISGNYYLMASVNAKDKALIDGDGQQAYGIFSKQMLQAFTDPGARDNGRDVTFKSFFSYAKTRTELALGQKPYSIDGNLSDEVFFQQASVANIQHAIKHDVSEKAIYRKLFVIGSELLETPVQSERFLYGRLKRRHVVSFLQPRKTGPNTLIYEFVSPEAFHRYLRIATFLGIIHDREDSLLTLTTRGREMMVRRGRNYNAVLAELLEEYWTRNGLQVTAFEDAIHLRIRRGDAPSLRNIHRDLTMSGLIGISKQVFQVLFELTAYVGALNYSSRKDVFSTSE